MKISTPDNDLLDLTVPEAVETIAKFMGINYIVTDEGRVMTIKPGYELYIETGYSHDINKMTAVAEKYNSALDYATKDLVPNNFISNKKAEVLETMVELMSVAQLIMERRPRLLINQAICIAMAGLIGQFLIAEEWDREAKSEN